jgi:hypothetical protein
MLRLPLRGAAERYALAGTFAGVSLAALMSKSPHILIGYGAAPIIGYGLALSANKPDVSSRIMK